MGNPGVFDRMRADHQYVLKEISSLDEAARPGPVGTGGSVRPVEAVKGVLSMLARQFESHMAAEDEVLYPALVEALPQTRLSIEPLRAEHAALRGMLTSLTELLATAQSAARDEQVRVLLRDFVDLLRIHIRKEEAVVIGVAERVLRPREVEAFAARMLSGAPKDGSGQSRRPTRERGTHMKRLIVLGILVGAGIGLAGCGGNSGDGTGPSGGAANTSLFDAGPRAAEAPVDEALAGVGEKLFKTKTCSTCHAFGVRITGPDLQGVTERRSATWMEQQMLHPDVMTKTDPISRELLAKYAVQMPNLMLKPEEAKALVEFLKHKDKEHSEAH